MLMLYSLFDCLSNLQTVGFGFVFRSITTMSNLEILQF